MASLDNKVRQLLWKILGIQPDKTGKSIDSGPTYKGGSAPKSYNNNSLKNLISWYEYNVNAGLDDIQKRKTRYKDLTYMVYNDSLVASAADLFADEATQADSQDTVISVEAKECKNKK